MVGDTASRPGQTVRVVVRDAETQEALCDATANLQVENGPNATLTRVSASAAVSCNSFVQRGRHWNPPTRATLLVSLDGYVPEGAGVTLGPPDECEYADVGAAVVLQRVR